MNNVKITITNQHLTGFQFEEIVNAISRLDNIFGYGKFEVTFVNCRIENQTKYKIPLRINYGEIGVN